MGTTINERLAILETRMEQVLKDGKAREDAQNHLLEEITSLQELITKHNATMEKYKGFIGGILFVVSCIYTFIAKFGESIWHSLMDKASG